MARQPVVFVGHGSPMNAITTNAFTATLTGLGRELAAARPRAILAVSAHWQTRGTRVTTVEAPRTIHDFGGFPRALFDVRYPAAGDPALARRLAAEHEHVGGDESWGLDHGTWSVLRHMFPAADVPVVQLSLNLNFTLRHHLEFAQTLGHLRESGVLIVASGNVTHNLRAIDWHPNAAPFAWAVEFDAMTRAALIDRDLDRLTTTTGPNDTLWRTAHPTLEHYLPLLYAVGASDARDAISFPNESIEHGSLAMRSVVYR